MLLPASPQRAILRTKLTESAKSDIAEIRDWSVLQFGVQASLRYQALIKASINDIATKSDRLGVRPLRTHENEISSPTLRTYHLRCSKYSLPKDQRVQHPRHIIVFRCTSKVLEVLRVLHESMDMQAQLEAN